MWYFVTKSILVFHLWVVMTFCSNQDGYNHHIVRFSDVAKEYFMYGTLVYVTKGTLRDGSHLMEMVYQDWGTQKSSFFFIHNNTAPIGKTWVASETDTSTYCNVSTTNPDMTNHCGRALLAFATVTSKKVPSSHVVT